jgi:hypothetical protein
MAYAPESHHHGDNAARVSRAHQGPKSDCAGLHQVSDKQVEAIPDHSDGDPRAKSPRTVSPRKDDDGNVNASLENMQNTKLWNHQRRNSESYEEQRSSKRNPHARGGTSRYLLDVHAAMTDAARKDEQVSRRRIGINRIRAAECRAYSGRPQQKLQAPYRKRVGHPPERPSLCHPERGRTPESKDPGTARADIADWSFRMERRRVRAGLEKIEEVGLTGRSRWAILRPTWTNESPHQKNSHVSSIGVLRLGRSPSLRMTRKRRSLNYVIYRNSRPLQEGA